MRAIRMHFAYIDSLRGPAVLHVDGFNGCTMWHSSPVCACQCWTSRSCSPAPASR